MQFVKHHRTSHEITPFHCEVPSKVPTLDGQPRGVEKVGIGKRGGHIMSKQHSSKSMRDMTAYTPNALDNHREKKSISSMRLSKVQESKSYQQSSKGPCKGGEAHMEGYIGTHTACNGLIFETLTFDRTGCARYIWTCAKCGLEVPGQDIQYDGHYNNGRDQLWTTTREPSNIGITGE
jgi:hypothetical protein